MPPDVFIAPDGYLEEWRRPGRSGWAAKEVLMSREALTTHTLTFHMKIGKYPNYVCACHVSSNGNSRQQFPSLPYHVGN